MKYLLRPLRFSTRREFVSFCLCGRHGCAATRVLPVAASFKSLAMRCVYWRRSVSHGTKLTPSGVCFKCCGRLSSGNRYSGRRKALAARKALAIGAKRKGSRSSTVTLGAASVVELLHRQLHAYASAKMVAYVCRRFVVGRIRANPSNVLRLTFIEGPSFAWSYLAEVNAQLGGASLRIIEPSAHQPSVPHPPSLRRGVVRNWYLDLSTQHGSDTLVAYLSSLKPVHGTELLHYHASPPCTGTSVVTRNINAHKAKPCTKRYHVLCRKMVGRTRVHISSYRKGGFGSQRSSSAEQPKGAKLRSRPASRGHPLLIRNSYLATVNGCVCGARGCSRKTGISKPVCKAWIFQTDHPALAGLLSLLRCTSSHESISTFVERGDQDSASLSQTASYPEGLCWLFVGALSFRWRKGNRNLFS